MTHEPHRRPIPAGLFLAVGAVAGVVLALLILQAEPLNPWDVQALEESGERVIDPGVQAILAFAVCLGLGALGWGLTVLRRRAAAVVDKVVERQIEARLTTEAVNSPTGGRLTVATADEGQLSEHDGDT